MSIFFSAIQAGGLATWIAGHWVALLTGAFALGLLYFFAALVLGLPLPFEGSHEPEEAER